jgi:hypothetical protein
MIIIHQLKGYEGELAQSDIESKMSRQRSRADPVEPQLGMATVYVTGIARMGS